MHIQQHIKAWLLPDSSARSLAALRRNRAMAWPPRITDCP